RTISGPVICCGWFGLGASARKQRSDIPRRTDRHELKLSEVAPLEHPLHEEAGVVALHQLEAAGEVGLDPTVDVTQPIWQRPTLLADPLVDRRGVSVPEPLDDHEQHIILRCRTTKRHRIAINIEGASCNVVTLGPRTPRNKSPDRQSDHSDG